MTLNMNPPMDHRDDASISERDALALADSTATEALAAAAGAMRDLHFGRTLSYSRKVFIPLTQLCRNVCHYCTFAKAPRAIVEPYILPDDAVARARAGAQAGCKEALFTLGERPEHRYKAARDFLAAHGFASTLEYLRHVAERVLKETGVLPHINAGTMSRDEMAMLRPVAASMGLMLESASARLCEKGGPHYGSPDKAPARRLETIRIAGELRIPFTSGILIGIGETRVERIESLLALRRLHAEYGHIQEIIIQNFRAKPDTRMADAPEPDLDDLRWTLAVARLIFGPRMSIQAPPNLMPGETRALVDAGLNDWGGISPVTPDFVNPEAPWPEIARLSAEVADGARTLVERLTIYPAYLQDLERWTSPEVRPAILRLADAEGFARMEDWRAGLSENPPQPDLDLVTRGPRWGMPDLSRILHKARGGLRLETREIVRLFAARGAEFTEVCQAADELRRETVGDVVRYVVNRNINYTNICSYRCAFCAFSKGKTAEHLRGRPYDLSYDEISRRVAEAWERGATEVCMQGGIKPGYNGETYLALLRLVKETAPRIHVHAFSPLEVWHGATESGVSLRDFLTRLRDAGLGSLPGTAAEVLDDEVRRVICPDKITTDQWLEVIGTAHEVGLRTTATIMFGHADEPRHWAHHLLRIRDLQERTGGFTEFVPLPFVAQESPIFLKGRARPGPTFREAILMHAVARLVLHPLIPNIQASWVKMGPRGVIACLAAGANDLGGTLMNESITRAAGATHGQEMSADRMEDLIRSAGRVPQRRTTLYGSVERVADPLV